MKRECWLIPSPTATYNLLLLLLYFMFFVIDYTINVLLGFCHGMCHIVPCNKGLTMSGVMGSTPFQTKLWWRTKFYNWGRHWAYDMSNCGPLMTLKNWQMNRLVILNLDTCSSYSFVENAENNNIGSWALSLWSSRPEPNIACRV
jgi:hypothetical protein